MDPLDSNWLRAHPLPPPDPEADKNSRGRVLVVGGCGRVPGGLLLTGEAALRSGAGKLQMATIAAAALPLGMAMPEAAVFALEAGPEGEISEISDQVAEAGRLCDAAVLGPAMSCKHAAGEMLDAVLRSCGGAGTLILDAAVLMALEDRAEPVRAYPGPVILTPHIGEMAALLGEPAEAIEANRVAAVQRAAERFGAVVVLKGATSLIAGPGGLLLAYAGGGVGLATGGSGDVLAGLAAGLAARGASAEVAAGWAVWLHGEAGRRCAEQIGPIGFLARELLALVPGLMRGVQW